MSVSRPGRCGWTSQWIRTLPISKNFWAGQSGHTVAIDGKDRILVEQFIVGLPSQYAREVCMNCREDGIRDHVEYVRRLRSADRASAHDMSAVTSAPSHPAQGDRPRSVLCFLAANLDTLPAFAPKGRLRAGALFPSVTFVMHLDM